MAKSQKQKQVQALAQPVTVAAVVATPVAVAPQAAVVVQTVMNGVTAENFATFSKEDLIKGYGNKSGAIRGLAALGLKPGPISKQLGIRYQHARNVLSRPLKRVIKDERDAKAAVAGVEAVKQ